MAAPGQSRGLAWTNLKLVFLVLDSLLCNSVGLIRSYLDSLSISRDAKHLVGSQAQADLDVWPPPMSPPVVLADVAHLAAPATEPRQMCTRVVWRP